MIKDYIKILGDIPEFLNKYLELDILIRLKKVGYFCGMDYASHDVYNFLDYISRFDHSLTTALITWKFSQDKKSTIAALFHDIATPAFSHVIDYMNKDYVLQESTEEKTKEILVSDKKLISLLKEDELSLEDISDFKKYSIVDNKRPKLCSDRLDGVVLTSLGWTHTLKINEVKKIIDDITVYINEDKELELGFKSLDIAKLIVNLNDKINIECHTNYDNYMMNLLADITKIAINSKIISYDDLYILDEEVIIDKFKKYALKNKDFKKQLNEFFSIKLKDIPNIVMPEIKTRVLNPLVNNKRLNVRFYYKYKINNYNFLIAEDKGYIVKINLEQSLSDFVYQETNLIKETKRELEEYFGGIRKSFDIPIKFNGTKFQNKVWEVLKNIPYGNTVSYGSLAKLSGSPKAARAVGNACHNNPILIIVPCHRVVASNGLGGFGLNIEMKISLLELEKNKIIA